MKKKTLLRLIRRFEKLPLHHIDSSIELEPGDTEDGKYCTKYFNIVGYKYRGKFCIPALGEILLAISFIADKTKQYDALDVFLKLIKERKIRFASVENTEEYVIKIKQLDKGIEPMDRLILACAIADGADTFVTLDEKLIHNEKIEKEFGIKIRHPHELV
ncbi:MAG: PIN domain-containing protein [Candidatus Aenigmatarchaeota archaeon]|nr:hypothetical protein [Candidatus Aenigmarchaeota archaeon]